FTGRHLYFQDPDGNAIEFIDFHGIGDITAPPFRGRERRRAASDADGALWRLPPLDLFDFVSLGAAGRDNFDLVAFLLVDQRARERRADRYLARLGVGLGLADDL